MPGLLRTTLAVGVAARRGAEIHGVRSVDASSGVQRGLRGDARAVSVLVDPRRRDGAEVIGAALALSAESAGRGSRRGRLPAGRPAARSAAGCARPGPEQRSLPALRNQMDLHDRPRVRCGRAGRQRARRARELIHLLGSLREAQLGRFELGHEGPPEKLLFDCAAFKEALPEVSKARLRETLLAENPNLKPYVELLEEPKHTHTPATLARIWNVSGAEAGETTEVLYETGFFERRGDREAPAYWVPFLYRDRTARRHGHEDGSMIAWRPPRCGPPPRIRRRSPACERFGDEWGGPAASLRRCVGQPRWHDGA